MKLLLTTVLVITGLCMAQPPEFKASYFMENSGSKLDVGYFGSPCVTDWDGDGVKDAVLGIFSYGRIRFYKNRNTNSNPSFNGYEYIEADGKDISVQYG